MIDINLHEFKNHLRIKKDGDKRYVWDIIRKKYLVLQPEEVIRQLTILYLTEKLGYPIARIQVERLVKVLGSDHRFDIIVYDHQIQPYMLVECKSHTEKIDQKVANQIGKYNISLQAPYLLLTNGVQTYCYQTDIKIKEIQSLDHIPAYEVT